MISKQQPTQISRSWLSHNAGPETGGGPRSGGLLWIGLGWTLLGLIAVDQVLQYQQEQERQAHSQLLAQMQLEADKEFEVDWDESLPPLHECKITRVEPSLDGFRMLRNVRKGDVVQVLELNVGPNGRYHLCRLPSSNSVGHVGWYPIDFLEQVD